MEVKILNETKQPLLSRTSYELRISGTELTPTNPKAVEIVAEKVKADASLVTIQGIYQGYGSHTTRVFARVYESKESLLKVEPKKKKADAGKSEQKSEGQKPKSEGE